MPQIDADMPFIQVSRRLTSAWKSRKSLLILNFLVKLFLLLSRRLAKLSRNKEEKNLIRYTSVIYNKASILIKRYASQNRDTLPFTS